jgi:hypothetical protein
MKRTLSIVTAFIAVASIALPLSAQEEPEGGVGLGVFAGVALPQGSTDAVPSVDWQLSLNWGFYVNIPLIYSFHLTASSELYRFGEQNATDLDIAFKFIIPLDTFHLFFGFAPGFTAVGDVLDFHIGALAGGGFNLVSNIDAFVQGKYTFVFDGNENLRVIHVNAGLLFNF